MLFHGCLYVTIFKMIFYIIYFTIRGGFLPTNHEIFFFASHHFVLRFLWTHYLLYKFTENIKKNEVVSYSIVMSRIPRVHLYIRGGVHGKKQKNNSHTFYTTLFLYYNIFKIKIIPTIYIILLSIGIGRIFNHQLLWTHMQ